MATREVTIAAEVGLHARPAAAFAKAAAAEVAQHGLTVTVGRPGASPVDASSIVALLTLGARQGETLVLEADGEDADGALDRLAALIESESHD